MKFRFVIIVIILLISFLPVLSKEQKVSEAEKHAIAGLQAYQSGNFQGAEQELSLAVKLDPKNVDYRKVLGNVYVKLNNYDKAIEQYLAALKLKPKDVELNYNLAYVYDFFKKDPEKAKTYYAKSLELDTKGTFAESSYLYLGNIYFTQKDYDKAIVQYKGAVGLKGSNIIMGHYNLGLCYLKTDKLDLGEKEFLEAEKLNSTLGGVYGYLGEIYLKKKDFVKAVENYKQAILYDSGNYEYHKGLAKSYEEKGETDSAIQEYNTAISMNTTDAQARYFLGSVYYQKKDYDHALEQLNKAVELDPKNKLYSETLADVQSKAPKITPTSTIPFPTATPLQGGTVSVNLSMKILEPKGITSGSYQCNSSKIRIVGIATAPSGSGIVEVLIDNVAAHLSLVSDQYKTEVPSEGNSLQFEGEALLTLGDNQVKISAMDKSRTRIETVIIIKRTE